MKRSSCEASRPAPELRTETERECLTARQGNANAGTCETPAGWRFYQKLAANGKRRLSAFGKAAGLLACTALFSFLFFSCELFNQPLSDYIEEWTEIAQVVRHSFDCDAPESGGAANLPSGGTRTLTYFLTNPQNYLISSSVSFAGGSPALGTEYTVAQDAGDRAIIRLTLFDTFLSRLDGTGTVISPTLHMKDAGSGRDFGSYTVPLRVNSPPAAVTEAVLLRENDTCILCFQLPDVREQKNANIISVRVESALFTSEFALRGQSGSYSYPAVGTTGSAGGTLEAYNTDWKPFVENGKLYNGTDTDKGGVFIRMPVYTHQVGAVRVVLTDSAGLTSAVSVTGGEIDTNVYFYVSATDGDDDVGLGTQVSPFATVQKAFEAIEAYGSSDFTFRVRLLDGVSAGALTVPQNKTVILETAPAADAVQTLSGASLTVPGGAAFTLQNVTLDGNSVTDAGVTVDAGGSLRMESGGTISGNFRGRGGGVRVQSGGSFVMRGGSISGNSSQEGGGVAVSGEFLMSGGEISGNESTGTALAGGVLILDGGTFTMSGGTISRNTAAYGGGVGVSSGGAFTMSGGTIGGSGAANKAEDGAGVQVEGTFTMTGGTISHNAYVDKSATTGPDGGGVNVVGGGLFTMRNGTISQNTSDSGGGVFVRADATFNMEGGSITGNTANGHGSGIWTQGTVSIKNASITGNTSSGSGGGVSWRSGGTLTLAGTVRITGNTDTNGANNLNIADGQTVTVGAGGISGSIGVFVGDPLDGTAVQITEGDVTNATAVFSSDVEGYGIMRASTPSGGTAVFVSDAEVSYYTANNSNVLLHGSLTDAMGALSNMGGGITLLRDICGTTSLAFSSDSAMTLNDQPIDFSNVPQPVTLDLNGHKIDRELKTATANGNVIKLGSGANLTIIDTYTGTDRSGKITGGWNSSSGGGVLIEGGTLTLESGSICGNKTSIAGGGIYISNGGTLAMRGGNIGVENEGNSASTSGGGIYVNSGITTISGGSISYNTSSNSGGGIYVNSGTATITGGSISYNQATGGSASGGGISISSTSGSNLTIAGTSASPVVISNNTAGSNGGGILVSRVGTEISHARVTGNTANGNGGGITVTTGHNLSVFNNVVVDGNTASTGGGMYVQGKILRDDGIATYITITNNTANTNGNGGGVNVADNGEFLMGEGCEISGNIAGGSGGGVVVTGKFVMSDGTVKGNRATNGGGVFVSDNGKFTMSGGTIGGSTSVDANTGSSSGGVAVWSTTATFTVSNAVQITGNTSDGADSNVYLKTGAKITIGTGGLDSTSKIGVTTETAPETDAPIQITDSPVANAAAIFISDAVGLFIESKNSSVHLVHPMVMVTGNTIVGSQLPTGVPADASQDYKGVFIDGRSITLSSFYISKYALTQAEYEAVMGTNPSNFTSNPAAGEAQRNRPVESVSWYDALVYCNTRSMQEGLAPCYSIGGSTDPAAWGTVPTANNDTWNSATCDFHANGYRLPTEAEWEYAARGGDTSGSTWNYLFSGSQATAAYDAEADAALNAVGWYRENASSMTHEVGRKAANALGLYDMSGNVWEWCWDWYNITLDANTPDDGPASSSKSPVERVRRGGANYNYARLNSVAYRIGSNPELRNSSLGFRVVRSGN